MKWLTKTEIARRAKKSYKEALLVSIEHHQQIAQATRKEFFEGVGANKVAISSRYCGLCSIREKECCGDCFLSRGGECGYDWKEIRRTIDGILIDNGSWSAVVKAEKDMIKVLKKELRKYT